MSLDNVGSDHGFPAEYQEEDEVAEPMDTEFDADGKDADEKDGKLNKF